MKRLLIVTCSLLVFFAGVASAWANCKQIAFEPDKHHGSKASAHRQDHHSDHKHSHDALIHCATVSKFVPVATFSPPKDSRVERLLDTLIAKSDFEYSRHGLSGLIHGPPGFEPSSSIPHYLLLSVLRI